MTLTEAKKLAQEAIEHAKTRGVTSTQLIQLAKDLLDSLEREEKYKAALERIINLEYEDTNIVDGEITSASKIAKNALRRGV